MATITEANYEVAKKNVGKFFTERECSCVHPVNRHGQYGHDYCLSAENLEVAIELVSLMAAKPDGGDDRYVRRIRKVLQIILTILPSRQGAKRIATTGLYYTLDPKMSMEVNAIHVRNWLLLM